MKNEGAQDDGRNEAKVAEPQTARIKPHGRFSAVWFIPIVAAGLVIYLGYSSFVNRGPTVTLTLKTAEGITVDQTQVKHKAVTLGTVEDVSLAPDMKSVIVKIRMTGEAKELLTDHARFWVVRPRLSAGSLTGIETIVSGSYIEVDPGDPGGKKQHEFRALDDPPGRQSDEPGQTFVLKAKRLGSLSTGAPIYYRDVEVGELLSYELGEALGPVTLKVFVREPYDKLVHPQTRFWNASGLSVAMGAEGMHIELESLQSLLSGGIAFETPKDNEKDPPAPDSSTFELYDDKASADAAFYKENIPYVSYFHTSVQGLTRGSPVNLSGVQVGSVSDVRLVYDYGKQSGMVARVAFNLQPERILSKNSTSEVSASVPDEVRRAFADPTMKVTLESSSFLTGSKNLSINYDAKEKVPGDLPKEGEALVLPAQGGGLDGLTASLADVASKVDKMPFEQIGDNANGALASIQQLADKMNNNLSPALAKLPGIFDQASQAITNANGVLGAPGYGQNSEFQHNMERMMSEVNDAARSFRVLADYLDRHPESLLRGRAAGEK